MKKSPRLSRGLFFLLTRIPIAFATIALPLFIRIVAKFPTSGFVSFTHFTNSGGQLATRSLLSIRFCRKPSCLTDSRKQSDAMPQSLSEAADLPQFKPMYASR